MNKFIKNNFIKFLAIPLFLYSSVSQAIVASPNPIPGSEIGVAYLKQMTTKFMDRMLIPSCILLQP